MSDLERAAAALRALHDGRSDDAARTRARILLFASSGRKRRSVFALVMAPLAAALVVSMAWAASTGRISGWLDRAFPRAERSAKPTAAPPPMLPTITPSATSDAPERVEIEAPDAGAPTPTNLSRATPTRTPDTARDAGTNEEDAVYQRAHQAHFGAHDSAAALRGWDDYLRAYPNGRFALEAQYNRALALVRLGRYSEGRAALAPFAAGRYGGYRQSEARALLDAMDAGP